MDDDNYTVEYADFLKIYQRVNKNVEINVFNRISNNFVSRNHPAEATYSMFFGHSLDVTDENVIKEAIKVSIKVYILYYDDKHKASMIKNLLKMYSRDEFERLCLSYNHKVVFIKQQPMSYNFEKYKINNYFKCINGMKESTLEYFRSREFDKLNLNAENYLYLLEQLSECNNLDKETCNNQNKKLIFDINKNLYLKMMNNHNLNYFDYDFEKKQNHLFGYELDNETGEKIIYNFKYLNDEEGE